MSSTDFPRFWIYVHDEDGDLLVDSYRDTLKDAIVRASSFTYEWLSTHPRHSVHIVDQNNESQTCWVAGACTIDGREHFNEAR